MDLHLKGKRAIITGGTRGIGRAIAEVFADEGVDVAFCARNKKGMNEAVSALKAKGVAAYGNIVDVADHDAYTAWINESAEALGGIDIFIPNVSAGGGKTKDPWRESFEVDLMHTVKGCDTALAYLTQSKLASIVILGTVAVAEPMLAPPSYSALKAAMATYAKWLSQVAAPHGIRVNTVAPGPVYFEDGAWGKIKREMPDIFEQTRAQCALGRLATPEDVARAVVFLASPAASYITGSTLTVDGGYTKSVQY